MEKIASGKAINKTARLVTGKGFHFEPVLKPYEDHITTDIRPAIRKLQKGCLDLTGVRFGRFVVIGLSKDINNRWIVRCDCGNYEFRTAKSIRNPNNSLDRCVICRKTHYILKGKDLNDHR